MSRTDAHTPWWTYCEWYRPAHGLWCNRRYVCNLPERPVRHAGRGPNVTRDLCTWEPIWPAYREVRWLTLTPTPHSFIRCVWSGPERARERDRLGRMVKEYNATGELDDGDFPNWQARHGARWLWH